MHIGSHITHTTYLPHYASPDRARNRYREDGIFMLLVEQASVLVADDELSCT
jgi:hypothetical protein